MSLDPVDALDAFARTLRCTPQDIRRLAAQLENGIPTLRTTLADIEAKTGRLVGGRYPQGRARLLDGRLPSDTLVELTVYGDLPYTALEPVRVQADLDRLVQACGLQEVAKARTRGRPFADADPRCHGGGAGRQYLWCAKEVERQLHTAGYLRSLTLNAIRDPRRPGASRSKNLTERELFDYLSAVLWRSSDPRLDALLWATYRVSLARGKELRQTDVTSVNMARPSLSVGGKGGKNRELPVHRPVLEAVLQLAAARPPAASCAAAEPLFRTRGGHRVSVKRAEQWSRALHDDCEWAQGHELRTHALRHTGSAAINSAAGPVADGLVLGHSRQAIYGTTGIYLPDVDPFPQRREAVEAAFGPLDAWPRLPENDLLDRCTGLLRTWEQ
jgi:hypothetical protein